MNYCDSMKFHNGMNDTYRSHVLKVTKMLSKIPLGGWVLLILIGMYGWLFGSLTWRQQSNFGTFGFDMGIYDQGIWLLSRFQEPFVTVRGLNLFGHHVNLITLFFVPFYWLGAGPKFLYLTETFILAVGAVPIWLLARDRFKSQWLALIPAGAYLLYPSLQWINWWHFHPDALIITPLLFAWWFQTRRTWTPYFLSVCIALSCKEDAAIAVFMMGVLMMVGSLFTNRRRPKETGASPNPRKTCFKTGLATMMLAAAWWFAATKLIIPWANGGNGPFYAELFPGFGKDLPSVIVNILRDPKKLWDMLVLEDRLTYYIKLFSPVGFLALLSPEILIGLPQILVNSISAHGYTHDIKYHYNAIIIAALFISSVETIGRARKFNRPAMWALLIILAVCALGANKQWSPSPLSREYRSGIWASPHEKHDAVRAALKMVPADAGVTAAYYIVPHLTHRRLIYEFPNPFRPANWGIGDQNPGDPDDIDFLVIDTGLTGSDKGLYENLVGPEGPFQVVFSERGIEVAKRRD